MLNLNFLESPTLITHHLILRPLIDSDCFQIHLLRSDPEVNQYLDRAISTGIEEAKAFIAKINEFIKSKKSLYWAITFKTEPTLIGTICFWNFDVENSTVEIGYELLPAFHGKGIMKEAIETVIEYGLEELGAEKITAFPSADNTRSVTLLEKMKFKKEDKRYSNFHENVDDLLTYTLEKEDYP